MSVSEASSPGEAVVGRRAARIRAATRSAWRLPMCPRGWSERRELLATPHDAHTEAEKLRSEADALLGAWTTFADRVLMLGLRHGVAGDAAQILDTLEPRLTRSRANQRLHAQRRSDIAAAEQGLAQVAERLDGAVARPEEVRSAVRRWQVPAPAASVPAAVAEPDVRADVDPARVRAWARANNMQVADRGRIREDVVARYRAANGG